MCFISSSLHYALLVNPSAQVKNRVQQMVPLALNHLVRYIRCYVHLPVTNGRLAQNIHGAQNMDATIVTVELLHTRRLLRTSMRHLEGPHQDVHQESTVRRIAPKRRVIMEETVLGTRVHEQAPMRSARPFHLQVVVQCEEEKVFVVRVQRFEEHGNVVRRKLDALRNLWRHEEETVRELAPDLLLQVLEVERDDLVVEPMGSLEQINVRQVETTVLEVEGQ